MFRGEIWLVRLDPTKGQEIQKTRPCVIVSSDGLANHPLKLVVPITAWREVHQGFYWTIRIDPAPLNGLTKIGAADACQLRAVDKTRFVKCLGAVSDQEMADILAGIALVVEMS